MTELINKILTKEKSSWAIHKELLSAGVKVTRKDLLKKLNEEAVLTKTQGRMKYWKRKE